MAVSMAAVRTPWASPSVTAGFPSGSAWLVRCGQYLSPHRTRPGLFAVRFSHRRSRPDLLAAAAIADQEAVRCRTGNCSQYGRVATRQVNHAPSGQSSAICGASLQRITASPSKISDIAPAALILTRFEHGYIK